ncbi:hypothetical protein KAW65_00055 [candidate division WOR-3 bacterium]|nr:hypothetical protein [candidate division WOR-3 bacterium]
MRKYLKIVGLMLFIVVLIVVWEVTGRSFKNIVIGTSEAQGRRTSLVTSEEAKIIFVLHKELNPDTTYCLKYLAEETERLNRRLDEGEAPFAIFKIVPME